jgi:hypothetical protein
LNCSERKSYTNKQIFYNTKNRILGISVEVENCRRRAAAETPLSLPPFPILVSQRFRII